MMIPLQSISQRKYIISNDTIIGYTLKENRTIALIFIKGEEAEKLNFKYEEIIKYKDSVINHNNYIIKFMDSTIQVQYDKLDSLSKSNIQYQNDIIKERKAKRTATWIAIGSGIINVLLISLLI